MIRNFLKSLELEQIIHQTQLAHLYLAISSSHSFDRSQSLE